VLIHHYGHGGGGMSLSWGTAMQAVPLAGPLSGRKCVVVGGGVMGLSTARLLQRYGAHVTVIAKALPPETTSNASGAQWWPFSVFEPRHRTEEFGSRFVEAARLSFQEFQQLVGPRWGVRWLPNYYLSGSPHLNGWMGGPGGTLHDLQIAFRDFGPGEHVFPLPYVRRFFTMMIEPSIYLATLLSEVQAGGATIVVQEIRSRDELMQLPHDLIFNCTGLGAAPLTGDRELFPIKGQLSILMPQPGVDYNLIFGDYDMFPRSDGIVLGGTYVRGQTDLSPDAAARDRVLSAHRNMFTQLRARQEGR
jgi:glycine/D-amino acid oxidase-like deaminating enzyme